MGAEMSKAKPSVVYLHRYPPEVEALQWPALRELAAELAGTYELIYMCMGPADGRRDAELRKHMRVVELPFTVNQANGRDKWLKTFRWYGRLGGMLREIRALAPAAILCKETLPFIPGLVVRMGIPTLIGTNDWWWSILLGHWRWGRWLADRLERREVRGWNRDNVKGFACTQAGVRLLAARGMDPRGPRSSTCRAIPRCSGRWRPRRTRRSWGWIRPAGTWRFSGSFARERLRTTARLVADGDRTASGLAAGDHWRGRGGDLVPP
jgi:hypothetical protein